VGPRFDLDFVEKSKISYPYWEGAHGSVLGWGTMLQTGRLRVRLPIRSLYFSIDLILPGTKLA
jgi:hypothetical protein